MAGDRRGGRALPPGARRRSRPAFVACRTDPWARADAVAWGEVPVAHCAHVSRVAELAVARRPVAAPSQVIHGDLAGNVLFADHVPPAIIDLSPLHRPADYASAVVVADALVWQGAGEDLLDAVAHVPHVEQLLLRALIFRAVSDRLLAGARRAGIEGREAYRSAVNLVLRRAGVR